MSSSSGASAAAAADAIFAYDEGHIAALESDRPWTTQPKFFRHVKISAIASMKMLKHAMTGVEQGRRENGISFEVMGLIVGKPDGDTIIVMDAYPLPVKGAENAVVADNAEVQEYMVQLSDALEKARPERFVGWYHSHPFDADGSSHCYLSATDVGTQFSWQNQLDPWVALVIDPLRSLSRQEPDIQAFRCYPIAYNPPRRECPDGTEADDETKQQRWGKVANRYYRLECTHFMSSLGGDMLAILARDHLWMRVLSSASVMEPEMRARLPDRISAVAKALSSAESQLVSGRSTLSSLSASSSRDMQPGSSATGLVFTSTGEVLERRIAGQVVGSGGSVMYGSADPLGKTVQAASELATELSIGQSALTAKDILFNTSLRAPADDVAP